jgi:hypothetical protein
MNKPLELKQNKTSITLSDMALAGSAHSTLARMLDFLSRGRNQSFQTFSESIILYSDIIEHLEKELAILLQN